MNLENEIKRQIIHNHLYNDYDHTLITNMIDAENMFRRVLIDCFKQDKNDMNELKEHHGNTYSTFINNLDVNGLLISKDNYDDGIHNQLLFSHEITTFLTDRGIEMYNNIVNDDIWNKAIDAFEKNNINPSIWNLETLCKLLDKER